jgi:hypothetical protein
MPRLSFNTATGITCVVRNISAHGALIEVSTEINLPAEFTLIIKPEMLSRNCRLI